MKIKPCWACWCPYIKVIEVYNQAGERKFVCKCLGCGNIGEEADSEAEAIKKWIGGK